MREKRQSKREYGKKRRGERASEAERESIVDRHREYERERQRG
jgi:hypothetical protein